MKYCETCHQSSCICFYKFKKNFHVNDEGNKKTVQKGILGKGYKISKKPPKGFETWKEYYDHYM